MKLSKDQKQKIVIIGFIAIITLFLFHGSLFSIINTTGRINATDQTFLDKLSYNVGDPIVITWKSNPNPTSGVVSGCTNAPTGYTYLQAIDMQSLTFYLDGQKLVIQNSTVDPNSVTPSTDFASTPFMITKRDLCRVASPVEMLGANAYGYVYACLYYLNGKTSPIINPNNTLTQVQIPQNLLPGNHTLEITWQGTQGDIAISTCGDITNMNFNHQPGIGYFNHQSLYSELNFAVLPPPIQYVYINNTQYIYNTTTNTVYIPGNNTIQYVYKNNTVYVQNETTTTLTVYVENKTAIQQAQNAITDLQQQLSGAKQINWVMIGVVVLGTLAIIIGIYFILLQLKIVKPIH